jgi:hypothetical protein
MKFELKPYHRNVPQKALLADLKSTAARLGKTTLTAVAYNREGNYSALTIIRRFGTWNQALKKANLQISNHYNIPIPQLFANLRQLWIKLGRQPTLRDMYAPQSRYSLATYAHRFGTWRSALQQFVTYINTNNQNSQVSQTLVSRSETPPLSPDSYRDGEGAAVRKTTRTINWRLRFRVMQRDNFRCVACGQSPAKDPRIRLHIDHITAWRNGGETVYENLQTLCHICNIGKGDLTAA